MKLYRHYKNKPYKYIGLAKHSETLEEMVIYETLYENANASVWVRPKKMFFESIDIDGKSIERFKKISLEIKTKTDVTESDIQMITPIIEKTLGQLDPERFYSTFNKYKKFHLAIAFIEEVPVGFKLGFEREKNEFYSWLGGVLPEYRGLGIADTLMTTQHEWCRAQGYSKIETKTQNRFKAMLILNINHGFEIIGTDPADKDGLKIILQKKL